MHKYAGVCNMVSIKFSVGVSCLACSVGRVSVSPCSIISKIELCARPCCSSVLLGPLSVTRCSHFCSLMHFSPIKLKMESLFFFPLVQISPLNKRKSLNIFLEGLLLCVTLFITVYMCIFNVYVCCTPLITY